MVRWSTVANFFWKSTQSEDGQMVQWPCKLSLQQCLRMLLEHLIWSDPGGDTGESDGQRVRRRGQRLLPGEGGGLSFAEFLAWVWLFSFNLSLAILFLASLCRLEPWIQTGTSGYSTTLKRLCSIVLVVGFSLDTGILTWLGNGTEKAKVQHRKVDYDKHTLLYFLCFGGFCTARQNFQFDEKASWVE